ncbi:MAG: aldo/keto reductase [Candidatus Izemoplasmatales bacterium]
MTLTKFGKPLIELSRVGFGAWQLANPLWGEAGEEESIRLVRSAIEKGVNFFDTAPGYAGGKSEEILGRAIGSDRGKIAVSTKFGHNPDGSSDWHVAAIEPSLRASLARLKTTYADSLLLHNPPKEILEGHTNHFEELARLKRLGLIRAYGVSIDTREELKTSLERTDVDVVELLYNVFFQSARDLFEEVRRRRIFLVAKVPLDSGWLSGKYDEQSIFTGIRARWSREVVERRAGLVRKVKDVVGREDISLDALAFILSYDAVACVIPGIKSHRQMNDNLAALHHPMSVETKRKLEELYDREIRPDPLPW